MKGIVKYLIWWKRFIVKYNSWKKKKNLENTKEVVAEFEERLNTEVRQQEKLDIAEERDFKREKLLENI